MRLDPKFLKNTAWLIFLILSAFSESCSTTLKPARKVSSTEKPQCSQPCLTTETCMNSFTAAGEICLVTPAEAPLTDLILPFDSETEAVCTHSSGIGSHSAANAFFALDLATAYDLPAAIVRASADGVAYVLLGEDGKLCPEPSGKPAFAQASTCGQSWGNRVKILHSGGYFSFYVHLDHPLVKTGDVVHQGDPIGVEGWTGAAGHRHLHWSIQKLPRSEAQWPGEILEYTGESVPFHFSASVNGTRRDLSSAQIECPHAGIGQVDPSLQPRFRGVLAPY